MKRSKQALQAVIKKTGLSRRKKRKVPLREWFLDPDYYEDQQDAWEDCFEALETK